MIDRRTIGCTGDLGAIGSELKLNSSVPVIRDVLSLKDRIALSTKSFQDDEVPQSSNPYESPRERLPSDSEFMTTASHASVFWFLGAYFLIDVVRAIFQAMAHDQPFPWPLRIVADVLLRSSAEAIAALLIYGFVGMIFKRCHPATRISRTMAGVVFSSVLWVLFPFTNVVGFNGPPGIISLPVAAIASTVCDRYLARVARTVTEPSDARETSAQSSLNSNSNSRSP